MKKRTQRTVYEPSGVIFAINQAITLKYRDHNALIDLYDNASNADQELIDRVLVIICGYPMPTLIVHAEENEK